MLGISRGKVVKQALNNKSPDKANLKRLLSNHLPLLSILFGSALISFATGPFQNWDTNYEFQAASGVLKYGVPYTAGPGTMINQPPLGFYIDSPFFHFFGLSYNVGVAIVTFFGIGATMLVYLIGKAWYGKVTGLVASALFAVTPWQVIFSRSFLIDVQCLFFSLLFLLVGYYAVRKDSLRLFLLSGLLFGAAFLIKFYAVFMLFPLAVLYFHKRPKSLWRPQVVAAFFLPVIVFLLLWYKGGIVMIFLQDDFKFHNSLGSTPTFFFAASYLDNALGVFFLLATVFSVVVSVFEARKFRGFLVWDLVCLATIFLVVGVDVFLASGLNIRAPFVSAAKYDYQALPFLCLIAASMLSKWYSQLNAAKTRQISKWLILAVASIGASCLLFAFFSSMYRISLYSRQSTVAFSVEGSVAYAFSNSAPALPTCFSGYIEYLGFTLLFLGLLFAFTKRLKNKIQRP